MGDGRERDVVEVAFAADANYYCGLTVAVCSLARSASRAVKLLVHVVYCEISPALREELELRAKAMHPAVELRFYDVSAVDLLHFPEYASSRMTYARLALPELLGSSRFVIYSDVDVLWLADVAELWKLRDGVALVSCVPELSPKTIALEAEWFRTHNLPFDPKRYFSAGISFYNLDEIRRRHAFAAVSDFARRYSGFNCADQSMLYGVFGREVALLPARWQTLPRNGIVSEPGEPLVIHYAGEVPWKVTRITHMITDTQLLWFRACAIVFGESVWRSLRRFYSPWDIVSSRAVRFAVPLASGCGGCPQGA